MISPEDRARLDAIPKKPRQPKPPKPAKPRPACEKSEIAKYPANGRLVIWGTEPECPKYKRKGLALLYNPEHPGGQVTLMPVTDDGGDIRWRYRFVPGPCPYRYEKLDLEPGMAGGLPSLLRRMADLVEGYVTEQFGGAKEADKKDEEFKAGLKQDSLSRKIKDMGVF